MQAQTPNTCDICSQFSRRLFIHISFIPCPKTKLNSTTLHHHHHRINPVTLLYSYIFIQHNITPPTPTQHQHQPYEVCPAAPFFCASFFAIIASSSACNSASILAPFDGSFPCEMAACRGSFDFSGPSCDEDASALAEARRFLMERSSSGGLTG